MTMVTLLFSVIVL